MIVLGLVGDRACGFSTSLFRDRVEALDRINAIVQGKFQGDAYNPLVECRGRIKFEIKIARSLVIMGSTPKFGSAVVCPLCCIRLLKKLDWVKPSESWVGLGLVAWTLVSWELFIPTHQFANAAVCVEALRSTRCAAELVLFSMGFRSHMFLFLDRTGPCGTTAS